MVSQDLVLEIVVHKIFSYIFIRNKDSTKVNKSN